MSEKDYSRLLEREKRKLEEEKQELLDLIKEMLIAQDCRWENENLGHDWTEVCHNARKVLQKYKEGG